MLSDEEKEIFNNLKEYMQSNINKGYHKFIYNDLDWDFKCIDCINAIDKVLKQSKEIEELKEKNKKLQDKAKELIFEKQELTSALLDSIPNDKIKAKIEEINKEMLNEENSLELFYRKKYCKEILQSLLEKE